MNMPAFDRPNYLGGKNGQHRKSNQEAHNSPTPASSPGYSLTWTVTSSTAPIPLTISQAQHAALQAAYQRTINQLNTLAYTNIFNQDPNFKIEDAGISAGELVGHRCWLLHSKHLWSVFYSEYCWNPGRIEKSNKPPEEGWYGHGIHSFKEKDDLFAEYGQQHFSVPVVYGTIEMWGKVIEHEGGYRAEYAAIKSLDMISYPANDEAIFAFTYIEKERILNELRKYYRV